MGQKSASFAGDSSGCLTKAAANRLIFHSKHKANSPGSMKSAEIKRHLFDFRSTLRFYAK